MINVSVEGLLPLKRQMQLLMMPPATRRRLLYRVGQRVIRDSRKRIRTQTDLQGVAFKPGHNPETDTHRHKRGRRKLLAGLSKMIKVMRNDSVSATISFPGIAAQIAAKQQHGFEETVTAAQAIAILRKEGGKRNDPATKRQAKALRDLGFVPKGKRRTSNKDIMANMTVGQAGAIIRTMRAKQGKPQKQSWITRLPARSFLGATAREVTDYINLIFEQITQGLSHGTR
jgi:Phage virion morphogenesis family